MSEENYEIRNAAIEAILKDIGAVVGRVVSQTDPSFGFCLFLFKYDGPDMFYISNAERSDLIKGLEEFIAIAKQREHV
jgi:hypothetical protein